MQSIVLDLFPLIYGNRVIMKFKLKMSTTLAKKREAHKMKRNQLGFQGKTRGEQRRRKRRRNFTRGHVEFHANGTLIFRATFYFPPSYFHLPTGTLSRERLNIQTFIKSISFPSYFTRHLWEKIDHRKLFLEFHSIKKLAQGKDLK